MIVTKSLYMSKPGSQGDLQPMSEIVSMVSLMAMDFVRRGNAFALLCDNVSYLTNPGHPVLLDPVVELCSPLEESTVVHGSLGIFLSPHGGIEAYPSSWRGSSPQVGDVSPFSDEVLDALLREDHVGFFFDPKGRDSWARIAEDVSKYADSGAPEGVELIDLLLKEVRIFAKPDDDACTFRIYGRCESDMTWLVQLCLDYGMDPF